MLAAVILLALSAFFQTACGPLGWALDGLAGGPKHGHAVMEDVETTCQVRLGPGTLYGAIARLEARGLIEALPADDRRRPYRLTAAGSGLLGVSLNSLSRVASLGLRRLAST